MSTIATCRPLGRWPAFLAADQLANYVNFSGRLVATDGSLLMGDEDDGGIRMAAAVFPRLGDGDPIAQLVSGFPGSLLPEAAAIALAAKSFPLDQPLAIATDSAAVMFIAQLPNHSL
jgi:hypothetical protein